MGIQSRREQAMVRRFGADRIGIRRIAREQESLAAAARAASMPTAERRATEVTYLGDAGTPVFQPEVAARAIVHAAFHPWRESWVGFPAMRAILGARLLPGRWIDRYLAEHGYGSQMTVKESLRPLDAGHGSSRPLRRDRQTAQHGGLAQPLARHGTANAAAALAAGWALARRRRAAARPRR